LRLPPISGQALVVEISGEYRVGMDGKPSYSFQEPFSTSKIKNLVATLGNDWLIRYLESYTLNKNIPSLYQSLAEKQARIFHWVEEKSSRWLNKSQAGLCARLWVMQESRPSITPPIGREGLVRNMIALALDQSKIGRAEAAQKQSTIQDEFFTAYAKKLDEFLSSQEEQPFIVPDTQVEDEQGNLNPSSLEDVAGIHGFCLLVGLPGGGKSRVQAWVARKRLSENLGIDIFLDLREYVKTGMASPYEFAANKLIQWLEISVDFEEMRSFLIELDRKAMLYWHVENWDRITKDDQKRCLSSLASLTTLLISTEYPLEIEGFSNQHSLLPQKQVFHLPRWDERKISLFIEQYIHQNPDDVHSHIKALVQQLPGLASLPAGLRYICESNLASLVDILIGFLNTQQVSMGYPQVAISLVHSKSTSFMDWGNPFVNEIYEVVSAILRHGPVKEFDVSRLESIDGIMLGSRLLFQDENLKARTTRAEAMLEAGCYGGLLYRRSSKSYAFTVPEIGYLMAVISVYSAYDPDFILKQARDFSSHYPQEPSVHILMDYIKWIETNSQSDAIQVGQQSPINRIRDDE
jgi:hypothetical protein